MTQPLIPHQQAVISPAAVIYHVTNNGPGMRAVIGHVSINGPRLTLVKILQRDNENFYFSRKR